MPPHDRETPVELFGDLFREVQLRSLFADSKTFADAIARRDPSAILAAYREQRPATDAQLRAFVASNFDVPDGPDVTAVPAIALPEDPRAAIDALWDQLIRPADRIEDSSLIPLPNPYVVPGGRFREIYYWDSYFTMLGLVACGRIDLVEAMVENFAGLIRTVGHVPNGNRSYYCSRSQPPCFALMVELLAETKGSDDTYARYCDVLLQEHSFWMSGARNLDCDGSARRRVLRFQGVLLNRYWDDRNTPREESYREDVATTAGVAEPSAIHREIRAACESGWDFSSRWLRDPAVVSSLRTTSVVPVDLNCLIYKTERVSAIACRASGRSEQGKTFDAVADARGACIRERFFDARAGVFTDLLLPSGALSNAHSLAAVYPLYAGLATDDQAARVADTLADRFRRPGGWVTTLRETGLQWDAPNGWAPLQWLAHRALHRYGHGDLADAVARDWMDCVLGAWRERRVFMERYDVERPGRVPGGGEYPTQAGFGWTNGVLVALMDLLET